MTKKITIDLKKRIVIDRFGCSVDFLFFGLGGFFTKNDFFVNKVNYYYKINFI